MYSDNNEMYNAIVQCTINANARHGIFIDNELYLVMVNVQKYLIDSSVEFFNLVEHGKATNTKRLILNTVFMNVRLYLLALISALKKGSYNDVAENITLFYNKLEECSDYLMMIKTRES